jgi:hypothetical protein
MAFEYNPKTGSFSLNGVIVCNGYSETETVVTTRVQKTLSNRNLWIGVVANNGTNVRIFSISRQDYNTLTDRPKPWKETEDRVWFMATFKSIEGHLRTWISRKTFGQMFEECVPDVKQIMQQTTDACVSYFIRHKENDLYNELITPNHVIQSLVWKDGRFIGMCHPDYISLAEGVVAPYIVMSNCNIQDTESAIDLELANGHPILLTVFEETGIKSYKFITPHDEIIRRFRCRAHNRFSSLFAVEQLLKQTHEGTYLEELQIVKAELFTEKELEQYQVAVETGKNDLFQELSRKLDGNFVVFPHNLYRNAKIQGALESTPKNEDRVVRHQSLRDKVWNNLCHCTDMKTISAIDDFFQKYGCMQIE